MSITVCLNVPHQPEICCICFAIPISTANQIIPALMRYGKVQHAYIGIGGQNVKISRRITLNHGLGTNTGIFVMFVESNSPAHQAGLQLRDVIVGFNNQALSNMDELSTWRKLIVYLSLR
ncbi:S1C family serine protease [Mastigocoleus sp. MO_188.B34]|uniref:S1C family serine protease n=1 Tax=Mastigocoleus sp. MO_188.B34 TaxID=3036635 RepID=UPI003453EB06